MAILELFPMLPINHWGVDNIGASSETYKWSRIVLTGFFETLRADLSKFPLKKMDKSLLSFKRPAFYDLLCWKTSYLVLRSCFMLASTSPLHYAIHIICWFWYDAHVEGVVGLHDNLYGISTPQTSMFVPMNVVFSSKGIAFQRKCPRITRGREMVRR